MTPEGLLAYGGLTSLGYIGPGAGFAFIGSFLILFAALGLAVLSILALPFRLVLHSLRFLGRHRRPLVRRVVILGLDGLDPGRVRAMWAKGELPNLKALAARGTFSDLQTTCPPMSPVAWSSFATGVNPGKHNIFDFLNRDCRTYLPELSSTRIRPVRRRGLFRRSSAEITLLRKSQPFWKVLGENGVFSTILRVPITFPPEPFNGLSLSAMCVPDLRGTQGAFTYYTTSAEEARRPAKADDVEGSEGSRVHVTLENGRVTADLAGPAAGNAASTVRFTVELSWKDSSATLRLQGERVKLTPGAYSDWIPVRFPAGFSRATGICRFLLVSIQPEFRLYVTPINIDPEHPAMPISHPGYYSIYLAKLLGPFATLGLAEDTWALSDGILDERAFIRQTYDIHDERKRMFFESLKRTRKGLCCCVFDLTDRIQHMFFRYTDERRPAAATGIGDPVADAYRAADALVGELLPKLRPEDVLLIMSDHGFTSFKRNVNLNRWLEQEGYLVRRADASGKDYLLDVDWERTRAYAFGLSGLYINLQGREARGIVAPAERQALKQEIAGKLALIRDPDSNEVAIRAVYDNDAIYTGPYRDNGPDLVVGYQRGYRVSWETAKGKVAGEVFSHNTRPWSGDHCIDGALVPGALVCSHPIAPAGRAPHIMDIAPTVLALFGVPKPAYMDGRVLDLSLGGTTHAGS